LQAFNLGRRYGFGSEEEASEGHELRPSLAVEVGDGFFSVRDVPRYVARNLGVQVC
jgi:hypothetical protein